MELTKRIESAKSYDEQAGREQTLQAQVTLLEERIADMQSAKAVPTMPVIPKVVAIAIFREGVAYGVSKACDELEGQSIEVNENEYYGHFEVSFTKEIDLDDELDLNWLRSEVGVNDEADVIEALKGLCADSKFECRIHGVDDEAKDSASA